MGWPECALGDVIGDHGFRHLAQEADATPQTMLDEWIGSKVDIITMDVEGSEFEVLKGAIAILEWDRPVVFVVDTSRVPDGPISDDTGGLT